VKLIAEYCAEVLMSAVLPYITLQKVAHRIVHFSESHWGLDFCLHLCMMLGGGGGGV